MIVGRTSAFGTAQVRAGVKVDPQADCWIEWIAPASGILHCSHLSTAARAGIGLGLVILFLALIYFLALVFSLVTYRRRRVAQANQGHQPNGGSAYNGHDGLPPYAPQYQPQGQGGPSGIPDYAYDPNAEFAPPAGSPPQYHSPPIERHKGPYHV
ncbi:hypothetical protein BJY52DRAFT_508045 [Lactarius psammicola]|nr:hypothetical protein BJY52DRAFT_508045 [Lactarius psammicola]